MLVRVDALLLLLILLLILLLRLLLVRHYERRDVLRSVGGDPRRSTLFGSLHSELTVVVNQDAGLGLDVMGRIC